MPAPDHAYVTLVGVTAGEAALFARRRAVHEQRGHGERRRVALGAPVSGDAVEIEAVMRRPFDRPSAALLRRFAR